MKKLIMEFLVDENEFEGMMEEEGLTLDEAILQTFEDGGLEIERFALTDIKTQELDIKKTYREKEAYMKESLLDIWSRTPHCDHIWQYKKNGSRYLIKNQGSMKLLSDEWVPSVTYESIDTDLFFTRDLKTFLEKFEFYSDNGVG